VGKRAGYWFLQEFAPNPTSDATLNERHWGRVSRGPPRRYSSFTTRAQPTCMHRQIILSGDSLNWTIHEVFGTERASWSGRSVDIRVCDASCRAEIGAC